MGTEDMSSCTCSVCARTHRLRKVVTKACAVWVVTWLWRSLERGVNTMEERGEGGHRTSQRDRASSSLIVSAYFMVSGVSKGNGEDTYLMNSPSRPAGIPRVYSNTRSESTITITPRKLKTPNIISTLLPEKKESGKSPPHSKLKAYTSPPDTPHTHAS